MPRAAPRATDGVIARRLDSESGVYYLRARYYDPTTGQFMSVDPAVAKTRSPYAYVAGNPLNGGDPTGLDYVFCSGLTDVETWGSSRSCSPQPAVSAASVGIGTVQCNGDPSDALTICYQSQPDGNGGAAWALVQYNKSAQAGAFFGLGGCSPSDLTCMNNRNQASNNEVTTRFNNGACEAFCSSPPGGSPSSGQGSYIFKGIDFIWGYLQDPNRQGGAQDARRTFPDDCAREA